MIGVLQLIAGLGLLVAGGYLVVGGSASLAHRLGVPPLVIGITVLAFGTSAPELAVNVVASLNGTGAVAFGNIVGSNIANVGLILAIAVMIRPLAVQSLLMKRDIPVMIFATLLALGLGLPGSRAAVPGGAPSYDRLDGAVFLSLFFAFVTYTTWDAIRTRRVDAETVAAGEAGPDEGEPQADGRTLRTALAVVAASLMALAVGGRLTVDGALAIAGLVGLPDAIVGLTIVAVGTSLPELSATVMAARRGEPDLAVGNVVGSNIFNLLLVLGLSSTVRPVPVPAGGETDLVVMTLFAIAPLALSASGRRFTKGNGATLLAAYVLFVWVRVA